MENKQNMKVLINDLEFSYPSAQILKGITTEINQGGIRSAIWTKWIWQKYFDEMYEQNTKPPIGLCRS